MLAEAEHVVQHQHLAVAVGAGADADGGDRQLLGDLAGQVARHALDDHGARAGLLDGVGVFEQALAAAGLEAALRPCTLWPPMRWKLCGVRPMWPITGMSTRVIAWMVSAITTPPSSFTHSAPSFISRMELSTACCGLTW